MDEPLIDGALGLLHHVCLDLCMCGSLVNEPDCVWEKGQSESGLAVILVRNIMHDGGWSNDKRDTDWRKNEKVILTLISAKN